MRQTHSVMLAGCLMLVLPMAASGQKVSGSARLRALAKISPDSARVLALAQVPGGKIEQGELEREKGRVVYSFDIAVAGQPGVREVWIDAITGAVLSNEHETPAQERAEKGKAPPKKP